LLLLIAASQSQSIIPLRTLSRESSSRITSSFEFFVGKNLPKLLALLGKKRSSVLPTPTSGLLSSHWLSALISCDSVSPSLSLSHSTLYRKSQLAIKAQNSNSDSSAEAEEEEFDFDVIAFSSFLNPILLILFLLPPPWVGS
jgi:hypothetical protein